MMQKLDEYSRIINLLSFSQDDIVLNWEVRVRKYIKKSTSESSLIITDHLPDILGELRLSLVHRHERLREFGKAHGFQRAVLTKFSLYDLIVEFQLLRETIIEFIYPIRDINIAIFIHSYLDNLLLDSTFQFIETISDSPLRAKRLLNGETRSL